jgi:hypothetical protein
MIQGPNIIHGMETQWFSASKEVQETAVIKKVVGICPTLHLLAN